MVEEKCKSCGRILTNPESIKLGYGKTCYRIFQHQQSVITEPQEIVELKQKWNRLSLKNSVLEKKILKLETAMKSIMKHGIQINDQLTNNTEAIERIKKENDVPKTEQEINFMVIIQELKFYFEKGIQLEEVPESFLNHKSIYQPIAISII